jgi:hypothetical protein
VSGAVRLIGYRTAKNGQFLGTEVVHNADGIPVELIFGSQVVARATTIDGIYRFTGIRPGAYTARTRVFTGFGSATSELTVASFDVFATDTIVLASVGDIYPAPNPSSDTVGVYFDVPFNQHVDVKVRAMSGDVVMTLVNGPLLAGNNGILWFGLDAHGDPATGQYYWVSYEAVDGVRCQLLLR